jgi:hypothetical protein
MAQSAKKRNGLIQGLIYGLVPHTFCILFIAFSIVGATAATSLLKGLFYLPYFIEIIIALAFAFATISALFYLKRNGLLSWPGIKFKWKYLVTMYTTTIAINILFFWVIFPALANVNLPSVRASGVSAQAIAAQNVTSVTLDVDIPCPGHAPLIIGELKKVEGVMAATYQGQNLFLVTYDPTRVAEGEIMAQPVFQSFKATVTD